MRTRREQVQAYRFLTRRIVSALLSGEPETTELPMRRLAMAVFASVMVAALVFAGVGIYGLLNPGGRRPAERALIIERETGAKYLYLQGTLHLVLNYTSARLILGEPNPAIRTMSRRSLEDLPRGRPVGIVDAPDTLPAKSALLGLPWGVCSAHRSPTSVTLATHVFVGHAPDGGSALGSQGLLVSVANDAERYLLWNDHRLRIRSNSTLTALEWAGVAPVPVGEAFLNAIPAGPDLAAPTPAGAGTQAVRLDDDVPTRVGQIFRAGNQNYMMVRRGLTPIGDVAARLRLASGQPVTEISAQQAGRVLVNERVEPEGFPSDIPALFSRDGQLGMACAAIASADGVITVETFRQAADSVTLAADPGPPQRGADGVVAADRVVLPGGHAALVSTLAPEGATAPGNVYLVTDQGIKHPLPRESAGQVQEDLGYAGVRPVPVPGSILALVPTGPALDPTAATQFAAPATVGPPRTPPAAPPSAGGQ